MQRSVMSLLLLCLTLTLFALPATAQGRYTIELKNGTTFESLYQPRESGWDPEMLMVLTDVGNWVALSIRDVKQVSAQIEEQGFGRVIDEFTVEIGLSVNDAPTDEELAEQETEFDRFQAILERLDQPTQNYTVEQFVSPGDTGGIPLSFGGGGTPPIGGIAEPVSPPFN